MILLILNCIALVVIVHGLIMYGEYGEIGTLFAVALLFVLCEALWQLGSGL